MTISLKRFVGYMAVVALVVQVFGFTVAYADEAPVIVEDSLVIIPDEDPVPSDLSVEGLCSQNSSDFHTWKVTNNTESPIDFSWAIDSTTQDGSGTVAGGGSLIFDTVTEGNNVIFIYIESKQVAQSNPNNTQCGSVPPECGTELVKNGSFETPIITKEQGWDAFPSGANNIGWKAKWLNNEPMSGKPVVANLEFQNAKTAQSGDQFTELDSDWDGEPSAPLDDASVKIYQYLPTVVGKKYTIVYYTSPLPGTDSSQNKVQFSWGGDVINTSSEDGTANSDNVWTKHSYTLTATSSSTLLQFADAGQSNTFGSLLDSVSVKQDCSEPEPCTKVTNSFVSGTSTQFNGLTSEEPSNLSDESEYTGGTAPAVPAEALGFIGAWNGVLSDPGIVGSGAVWVNNSALQPSSPDTGNGLGTEDSWRLFSYSFSIPSGADNITASQLHFTGDNTVVAFLNNVQLATSVNFGTITNVDLPTLTAGSSYKLEFAVKNTGLSNEDNPSEGDYNPTGLIYHLDLSYDDCGDGGGDGDRGFKISGNVYNDNNSQDGNYNPEQEDGLAGWTVYLDLDNSNTFNGEEPSKTTDSNGAYQFNGLDAGCYTVREVLQLNWNQTEPADEEYTVGIGGVSCDDEEEITDDKVNDLLGFLFKTAHAEFGGNFPGDATIALNFGNVFIGGGSGGGGGGGGSNGGGGSGSGGSGGGSPTPPPTVGRVLGDSTNTPSTPVATGTVLGATTELPRTGTPTYVMLVMLSILGIIFIPKATALLEE